MSLMIINMQCPYCQTQLTEHCSECSHCSLSLKSANALLGPVPLLSLGVNDFLSALEKKAQKKINRSLVKLGERFPQVRMHIIVNNFNPKYSLATHLFWLFNQGALSTSDYKGGKNHNILLGLDIDQANCAIMVGYGLEPFLARKKLDDVLSKAQPLLSEGNYSDAILTIIDELAQLMEDTCKKLEDVLDISEAKSSQPNEY